MSRFNPDPEEADRLTEKWSGQQHLRLEVSLLVLPGVIGLYLVVTGFPDGAYLQVAIGLLLLVCTPFLARRLVRKSEFGRRND
jgi:hypothetical protein